MARQAFSESQKGKEPTPGFSRWFRMWEAFCEQASCVRLPIPAFLRITIPLMMACVDGLLGVDLPNANVGCFQNLLQNGIEMPQPTALPVGWISSSNNLEAIEGIADKYQRLSIELIGDTGAAHDIGSEEALTSQGLSPEVISSWKRTLENPLKFATAGGVQEAREVLSGWAGNIGELQVHLLTSCPRAMSIGKQIKKGRTFMWEFGKTPHIALNHKKCRVWCPLENRWFASRVKYDVPVFNVDLPGSGTEPEMPIVDSQDDVADAAEPDGALPGAFVRKVRLQAMTNCFRTPQQACHRGTRLHCSRTKRLTCGICLAMTILVTLMNRTVLQSKTVASTGSQSNKICQMRGCSMRIR